MKKIDLAIEATKIIAEHCTRTKRAFAESLDSIFQSPFLFPSLPQKRESSPVIIKPSTSPSSQEEEYDPQVYSKIKTLVKSSMISEEELVRVYSSDISSDNESRVLSSISDFERCLFSFNSSKTHKQDLEMMSKFLDTFQSMGLKERKNLAKVLKKFEYLKNQFEDPQIRAIFFEVKGKTKKILSLGFDYEEDWESLTNQLEIAMKDNNKEKIIESIRRIYSTFPDDLNEKIVEELEPLIKLLKNVKKVYESPEITGRVERLLEKCELKKSDLKTAKELESLVRGLDFGNSDKKAINTVDAKKTVPGKVSKR